MTTIQPGRISPTDLFHRLSPTMFRDAADAGVNFSVWLEAQLPSAEFNDGMDAYERLLSVAGIRTRSNGAAGAWSSTWDAFEQSAQHRALVPEFITRVQRSVKFGRSASTRALYSSTDDLPGTSLRPYADAAQMRVKSEVAAPIMLNEMVALTTPIDGNAYRVVYLNTNTANSRMVRVAEGAEIPRAKLTTGEHTINLLKYGRALESTYEALRRTRIEKVAFWLEQIAIQNEMDKVSQAINVLVSGDGNSGTAATAYQAQTDFDAAATGKAVTLKAYMAFKLKFFPLYQITHIFGAEADILKLILLNVGDSDAMTYLGDPTAAPGFSNMLRDGVRYGITANVPTDKLVAIDARRALERVVEIGANISEIERWITSQTQVLTLTEVEGYAVLQPGTVRTLELQA